MADPTDPLLDPNIAALDPTIRRMQRAQAGEILTGVGKTLTKTPPSPPIDYSSQRARLIGMLNQLEELETSLRTEEGKTLRSRLNIASSLISGLARIESASIGARGGVMQERIKFATDRMNELGKLVEKDGRRDATALAGTSAGQGINGMSRLIADGAVRSGNEVAFADQVQKDLTSITDPRVVAVYVDEVKNRYNIDLPQWMAGQSGNQALASYSRTINPRLQAGLAAQLKAGEVEAAAEAEVNSLLGKLQQDPGVRSGSALGRGINDALKLIGAELPAVGVEKRAPAATASVEEKRAYVKALDPTLDLNERGEVVQTVEGKGQAIPYERFVAERAPVAGAEVSEKRRPYLEQQRTLVMKELERLENADDPESRRLRTSILQSKELATWAQANGYENYRPEQQFKALLAFRRKQVRDQDIAFRRQLEGDILSGEAGTELGRAGIKVRQALSGETARRQQLIEAGLEEAKRRQAGKPGADIVGGATPPAERTPEGTTEAEPKAVPESEWPGGVNPVWLEKPMKEKIEEALKEEPQVPTLEEAEAAAVPASKTMPAGTIPDIAMGRQRGILEREIGTFLRRKDVSAAEGVSKVWESGPLAGLGAEISSDYAKAQTFKDQPAAYMAALEAIRSKIAKSGVSPTIRERSVGYGRGEAVGARAFSPVTPEEEPPELPEMETPPPVEEEEPMAEPEAPSPWGEAAPPAAIEPVTSTPEEAAPPVEFPAEPAFEASPEGELGAMGEEPGAESGRRMALLAELGGKTPAKEEKGPIKFESFGAEQATEQAAAATSQYQQMLAEREQRLRRRGLLAGAMA